MPSDVGLQVTSRNKPQPPWLVPRGRAPDSEYMRKRQLRTVPLQTQREEGHGGDQSHFSWAGKFSVSIGARVREFAVGRYGPVVVDPVRPETCCWR